MANEEHLKILEQGVKVWNRWREDNPSITPELDSADLEIYNFEGINLANAAMNNVNFRSANLESANLKSSHLSGSNLSSANLNKANLIGCNLFEAKLRSTIATNTDFTLTNLRETDLFHADFTKSNLKEANLGDANLTETDLSGAKLTKASLIGTLFLETMLTKTNFTGADIGFANFSYVDLSETKGLENITHVGPSTIGIDTLFMSKGKIPEIFLRGCGLSDLQIEIAKLAQPGLDAEQATDIAYAIANFYTQKGIGFYSCFISYNSQDQSFAQKLHDDLQNNGVRCWIDKEDLKIGDAIRPKIDQEIRRRDKLLVIISQNAIKSEWVGDEVEAAMEEEKVRNSLVLFPIRLDEAVLNSRDDWAAKIKRRRHIGDFSHWQDSASYQKAFERLLRDLKAPSDEQKESDD